MKYWEIIAGDLKKAGWGMTLCRFAHIWLRLHRIRHNSFSTSLLFWTKEARQRKRFGITNRESGVARAFNHFSLQPLHI
jgi:hypothetical protein